MDAAKRLIGKTYRHLMHDSLYRNSIYLLINLGFTAIAGFGYLLVAAHYYPQRDVGYATALIGALTLAVSLSNFGMNRTILRFMGKSKTQSRDLVTKLLLVAVGSVFVGLILCLFFKDFGIKNASLLTYFVFIITVFLMSIKGLLDNLFIALQKASGTLIENSLFSVVKVGFPLLVLGSGYLGIFSAQLAGALAAVLISVFIIRRFGLTIKTKPSLKSLKNKWSFALGSYTSDFIGNLPASILPIIVVAKLGPISGALWYASMQIINFILAISSSINQAMFAEMSNQPESLFKTIRKAALSMYGLVSVISIIIFIAAPRILEIFGKNYVDASTVLRLMLVFAFIGIANYITGSILALYKKVAYLTIVNTVNALIVLIYCLVLATNLNGIAVGWMLGEVANVILFVGGAAIVVNRERLTLSRRA